MLLDKHIDRAREVPPHLVAGCPCLSSILLYRPQVVLPPQAALGGVLEVLEVDQEAGEAHMEQINQASALVMLQQQEEGRQGNGWWTKQ